MNEFSKICLKTFLLTDIVFRMNQNLESSSFPPGWYAKGSRTEVVQAATLLIDAIHVVGAWKDNKRTPTIPLCTSGCQTLHKTAAVPLWPSEVPPLDHGDKSILPFQPSDTELVFSQSSWEGIVFPLVLVEDVLSHWSEARSGQDGAAGGGEEGRGEREEGGERREGSLGAFLAGTGECSPKTPSSGNGPVVPLILSRGRSEQEIQNNLKVFSVFLASQQARTHTIPDPRGDPDPIPNMAVLFSRQVWGRGGFFWTSRGQSGDSQQPNMFLNC